MAHKPKTYVPLGGNNVARRSSRNGIVIVDQTNNDCIELNQNEVAALRALITSPVTDEQITELIKKLDAIAQEYDRDSWGLPYLNKNSGLAMREAIRNWLTTLNQTSQTGKGAKE